MELSVVSEKTIRHCCPDSDERYVVRFIDEPEMGFCEKCFAAKKLWARVTSVLDLKLQKEIGV